jgi:uncharacterized protein
MAHGSFVWNEFVTNDVERAQAFYEKTVGWKVERMDGEYGTYWMAKAGDTHVAGIMDAKMSPVKDSPHWLAYLEVDDVDRRVKEVAANGGKILHEPFDVPGVGRTAMVADATGAPVGWMTSKR